MAVLLFMCLSFLLGSEAALKTTFLEELCGEKRSVLIELGDTYSGILMSVPQLSKMPDFDCQLQLRTSMGRSISLSVHRFDVAEYELLTVEDSDRYKVSLVGSGYFRDERKSIMSGRTIMIRYKTHNRTYVNTKAGFQFTYTILHEAPCYHDEFTCRNGKCLAKELLCDGHNHCGDMSDQKQCTPDIKEDPLQQQRIVRSINFVPIILSLLLIVVAILVIVMIVFIVKWKKAKAELSKKQNTEMSEVRGTPGGAQHVNHSSQHMAANSGDNSFRNFIRNSFKRNQPRPQPEQHVTSPVYQVPSMYPSISQLPTAPDIGGGAANTGFVSQD